MLPTIPAHQLAVATGGGIWGDRACQAPVLFGTVAGHFMAGYRAAGLAATQMQRYCDHRPKPPIVQSPPSEN